MCWLWSVLAGNSSGPGVLSPREEAVLQAQREDGHQHASAPELLGVHFSGPGPQDISAQLISELSPQTWQSPGYESPDSSDFHPFTANGTLFPYSFPMWWGGGPGFLPPGSVAYYFLAAQAGFLKLLLTS